MTENKEQILMRAVNALEVLAGIRTSQLGFGDPRRDFVYVKAQGKSPWYKWENETAIPIEERGLMAVVKGIEVVGIGEDKDFRHKLDLSVEADKPYVVRTGLETVSAKSLLLGLRHVQSLSSPLKIVASIQEGNRGPYVTLSLFEGVRRVEIPFGEQDAIDDWLAIANEIRQRLGQEPQGLPQPYDKRGVDASAESATPLTSKINHPANERIKAIRELLNIPAQTAVSYLSRLGKQFPSELSPEELDEFVVWMAAEWGKDLFESRHHAANSFRKHVYALMAQGHTEIKAIEAWMTQKEKETGAELVGK